jgi:hypothetical protein
MKKNQNLFFQKTVYNALCQHFLKARAPDQGFEPFLSPSKIAKRLEPSSPEPRIPFTTNSHSRQKEGRKAQGNKATKQREREREREREASPLSALLPIL